MVNTLLPCSDQICDKGFYYFMEFQEKTSGERKHFSRKREPENMEEIIKRCIWWWIAEFTVGVCFLLSIFPLFYIIFTRLWTCYLFSENQWKVILGICLSSCLWWIHSDLCLCVYPNLLGTTKVAQIYADWLVSSFTICKDEKVK